MSNSSRITHQPNFVGGPSPTHQPQIQSNSYLPSPSHAMGSGIGQSPQHQYNKSSQILPGLNNSGGVTKLTSQGNYYQPQIPPLPIQSNQGLPHSPNDTPPHSPYHRSPSYQNSNQFYNSYYQQQQQQKNKMSPLHQSNSSPFNSLSASTNALLAAGGGGSSGFNLQDLLEDDDPLKKKRKRTSPDQLKILEKIFQSHQHPNLSLRNQLAIDLQMTPRSVQIWFQNRRAKARNMEFKPNLSTGSIPPDFIYNVSALDRMSQGPPGGGVGSGQMGSAPNGSPLCQSPKLVPSIPHHHHPYFSPSMQSTASLSQNIGGSGSKFSLKTDKDAMSNGISIASIWNRILMNPRNSMELLNNYNPEDPNSIDVNGRDNKGLSLLFTASVLGYEFQVRRLIEYGANPNIRDNQGNTPLIAAALLGNSPILDNLLEHQADPNQINDDGVSPLYAACKSGHLSIVKSLLENHSEVGQKVISTGETCLHIASIKGYDKIVQLLLENDAKPNVYDNNNLTPLHHASIMGYFNIVKLLVSKGADKDPQDKEGHTPLHNAALLGQDLVVTYLLNNHAQVNTQDQDGYSALHYAVRESRLETVKILLKFQAQISLKTRSAQNVLHLSVQHASVMMGKLIFDQHFPLDSIDDMDVSGHTPLYLASKANKTHFVKYLISKGASVKLAIDLLLADNSEGHKEIINLLEHELLKEKEKEKEIEHQQQQHKEKEKEKESTPTPTSKNNSKISEIISSNQNNDDEDDYYTRTLYNNSTPNRILSNSFIYQNSLQ
ncbi:putative homeobox transcription factor [Tieghemostelium lacteum]|uniref:Putative homeobox transcription factor n=1 Tax=Tieghemostelium lacteum TaxID=361077 RepID=A0A151ZK43_TIELA|nr:putative homeobox transcription factor [Tieghemostelium lacteum]|eukprot:KYQ94316.1 putative homeobox transcription factor [Tieghemostelium lacteum]